MTKVNLNHDGELDSDVAVPSAASDSLRKKAKKNRSGPGWWIFLVWIVELAVLFIVGAIILAGWWLLTMIIAGIGWIVLTMVSSQQTPALLAVLAYPTVWGVFFLFWFFATYMLGRLGFRLLGDVHRGFSQVVSPSLSKTSDYGRY